MVVDKAGDAERELVLASSSSESSYHLAGAVSVPSEARTVRALWWGLVWFVRYYADGGSTGRASIPVHCVL